MINIIDQNEIPFTRMVKIKNTIPNVEKYVQKLELSYIAGGNVKGYSHTGSSLSVSQLPFAPAIPLQGTYSKRTENTCPYKNCTFMFTAALLVVAKKCNNQNVHQLTNKQD